MTPVVRVSPAVVWEAIRVGRMTALKEADGGVGGIVVGDFLEEWLRAPSHNSVPFHYALSTKARTECVNHILQTLTDMDAKLTILSVDGICAFATCPATRCCEV